MFDHLAPELPLNAAMEMAERRHLRPSAPPTACLPGTGTRSPCSTMRVIDAIAIWTFTAAVDPAAVAAASGPAGVRRVYRRGDARRGTDGASPSPTRPHPLEDTEVIVDARQRGSAWPETSSKMGPYASTLAGRLRRRRRRRGDRALRVRKDDKDTSSLSESSRHSSRRRLAWRLARAARGATSGALSSTTALWRRRRFAARTPRATLARRSSGSNPTPLGRNTRRNTLVARE